jgi:hypothetical protein
VNGYIELLNGNPIMWAVVIACVLLLVAVFAAVTIGKAIGESQDRRRHAGYLRDTHKPTNA